MDFEQLLKELEGIVAKLDDPSCALDEGINLFNRGIELSKQCLTVLKESKGKVALLKKESDTLTREEFNPLED